MMGVIFWGTNFSCSSYRISIDHNFIFHVNILYSFSVSYYMSISLIYYNINSNAIEYAPHELDTPEYLQKRYTISVHKLYERDLRTTHSLSDVSSPRQSTSSTKLK